MAIEVIANKVHKIAETLNATDRLLIGFWVLLSFASLILHSRFPYWRMTILANIVACLIACLIAFIAKNNISKVLNGIHHWAAYPLVVFTYKQIYYLIPPIHQGKDYDSLLIAMDQALFRVHPTQWMEGFSNPYLTELFQIFYSLFFVFFLVVGIELYRKHGFAYFRFAVVYGFLVSYIGYLFLPAVGPRFTLHDFSRIGTDLPGLFVTSALRSFINFFESIPVGAANSVTMGFAQRDVMPSGHTMMMVIMMVFVCREKLRCRNFIMVSGVLLIIATVYLRYHYVVDLMVGILLAIFCIYTADGLRKWIKSIMRNPKI